MIPHILSKTCLVIMTPSGKPAQIADTHPKFDKIYELVIKQSLTEEETTLLWDLIEPVNAVRKALPASTNEVELTITPGGSISAKIDGQDYRIPSDLGASIKAVYEAKGDLTPFVKFLKKLSDNPRKEVASELWGFIRACGLVLQEDGNFLAYKNVNKDFTSIYDNKTLNTPGTVVSMRRQDVQYDPQITCSHGLHFAAWGYLSHYSSGGKTVLLSISPADVVSIPTDYNNMKGRACQYTVLREVDQPEELKGKSYVNANGY